LWRASRPHPRLRLPSPPAASSRGLRLPPLGDAPFPADWRPVAACGCRRLSVAARWLLVAVSGCLWLRVAVSVAAPGLPVAACACWWLPLAVSVCGYLWLPVAACGCCCCCCLWLLMAARDSCDCLWLPRAPKSTCKPLLSALNCTGSAHYATCYSKSSVHKNVRMHMTWPIHVITMLV